MKKFEFEEKNENDFQNNTNKIIDALEKIRSDPSLRPFVKTITDLTGIHRNTISNRVWPLQKLDQIKSEREAKKNKDSKKSLKSTENILQDKLNNAQKELLYWFSLHKNLNESFTQLQINYEEMILARDSYKKEAEIYKHKLEELQKNIELPDTLH